jgi:formylglycine-generating enzyme required for sulfatase activity
LAALDGSLSLRRQDRPQSMVEFRQAIGLSRPPARSETLITNRAALLRPEVTNETGADLIAQAVLVPPPLPHRGTDAWRVRAEIIDALIPNPEAAAQAASNNSSPPPLSRRATNQRRTRAGLIGALLLMLLVVAGGLSWMVSRNSAEEKSRAVSGLVSKAKIEAASRRSAGETLVEVSAEKQRAAMDKAAKEEAVVEKKRNAREKVKLQPDRLSALLDRAPAAFKKGPIATLSPGSGQSARDRLNDGRECPFCPEMVVVPPGSFMMGSPESDAGRYPSQVPQRKVTIAKPFAVGKFEVIFGEWDACADDSGCVSNRRPADQGWGRGRRPVINVSWEDAKEYVDWLSRKTGKEYRLLSEAEWEYATRAGTTTRYAFGDTITTFQARVWVGEIDKHTVEVGSFPSNRFGLHDMHGNVWEWVEDTWHGNYQGAPHDGSVWTAGDTAVRVLRGGSWRSGETGSSGRHRMQPGYRHRSNDVGFRVARSL